MNTFNIVGNITKDVELKYITNGTPTVTYVVAVDNSYTDREGKKHEGCDFIPVTTYGKQAEADAKCLKRGASVAITGSIKSWYKAQDKKGGFNFIANTVTYLSRGNSSRDIEQSQQSNNSPLSEHDQWAQDYVNAESAEQQGQSFPICSNRK